MLLRKAAAVAATVMLVACSGGGRKPAPPAPTTTSSTVPPILSVNKTINTGGFLVNVLTADSRSSRGLLKLATAVTNTLPSAQQFNPTFALTAGGRTFDGTAAKTPTISVGATVPVELDIPVDPALTLDDAVVTFGNSDKNQAVLPLGSAGTYTPLLDAVAVPPTVLTAGEQTFTFTGAIVSAYRYDGTELDTGTEELVLTASVANHDPRYSYAVDASAFKFANGAETLNSGVVKVASVNAGGTVPRTQAYADIDNYRPGATVTVTVIGTDASQANVAATAPIVLPNLG